MVRRLARTLLCGAALVPTFAHAQEGVLVDRVVAKWRLVEQATDRRVPERLIFARVLSFEARLEAMAGGEAPDAKVVDRYLRLALSRHVTEELLESLPLDPPPTPSEIAKRAEAGRQALLVRVGSAERLEAAMALERIDENDFGALLRRSARASFYLERMVAPLVEPTELELRELHAAGQTPFAAEPFERRVDAIRRWVLGQRLAAAVDNFWQQARSRLVIEWLKRDPKRRSATKAPR
jgi:hypothetical protein